MRGTVFDELYHNPDPGLSEANRQLVKFFGMYQQRDRDRKTSLDEAVYTFMVRIATAAGSLTAAQYTVLDALAQDLGHGSLRLTTRQAVQIHGVAKNDLPALVQRLTAHDLTSLAGCGDVVRNVVACPWPDFGGPRDRVRAMAHLLSDHFKPQTRAYVELFVAGQKVWEAAEDEPLYGEQYLPRKFKIGLTVAGDNCIDVYSHDVGLVFHPATDRWTVLVGGGLGQSQGVANTHAALAHSLGTITTEAVLPVVEAIVTVQRDFGRRDDRKFARLKYLIEDWGLNRLRAAVIERTKRALDPPVPLDWDPETDHLGLHDPKVVGVWLPQGRIRDTATIPWARTLRHVIAQYQPCLQITPQHHLLLVCTEAEEAGAIRAALVDGGIPLPETLSPIRRYVMACPALPTCGLALAEAERVIDAVVAQIETKWQEVGLSPTDLRVRVTGCSNNCARSFLAEVGLVGAAPGRYHVYVGGTVRGTRLARLLEERIPLDAVPDVLEPIFRQYRETQAPQERFGDWCQRMAVGRPPRQDLLEGAHHHG
ncbi:hypothetical protein TPY_2305 [Sulfobacillus acidophilus TPY]|nr:hypothetical protein TPY_2305 [Sulfobacillus acidophilus TPY]